MTSQPLQYVTSQLAKLHGHAYFKVDDGPLKEALTRVILDGEEGDLAHVLSGSSFGLEVNIAAPEGDGEPVVGYSVVHPGGVYRSEVPLARLASPALEDLAGYLQGLEQQPVPAGEPEGPAMVATRSQHHDHHDKESAAARLKVSPQWLKSVVPCTEYTYDEIEGKKYIRDYYWSKDLIERLFKIKSTKTTPEDLQFVAKECCEGDVDWARDLIARLKSPNRPEAGAREQSKEQPREQGQKQQKAAGGQAKQPAPGERTRSRRNRKAFRHGKEGGRKADPAAGAPKAPQS